MIFKYNKLSVLLFVSLSMFVSSCSIDKVEDEVWDSVKSTSNINTDRNLEPETKSVPNDEEDCSVINHLGIGKISIESEGQNLIEVEILGESSVPASTNWGDGCQGHVNNKTFHKYDSPEKRNMVMDAPNSNGVKLSTLSGIMTIDLSDY
ncbi:MAG: hypothetical protein MJZ73_00865 [Bacteroidaceae bacterium]|nr:hypothetical protein [Bacteroidaceae bacterium]